MAESTKGSAVIAVSGWGTGPGGATGWLHLVLAAVLGVATAACTGDFEPTTGPDGVENPGDDGEPGDGASDDDGEGDLPDEGDPGDEGGDDPVPVDIDGPNVMDHVQLFANAACGAVGSCLPSTYVGHHPDAQHAIDSLVTDAYGLVASDGNALGDALAAFALERQADFGIWYVIWRQRINYGQGGGWEPMEDRGSITQNHYDHVHVSFWSRPR
jgi:hypothetical protein